MKFFKKAKELFDKMTGKVAAAPGAAKVAVEEIAQAVIAPLPVYQQKQRDLERRLAAATRVFWDTAKRGTYRRMTEVGP